MQLICHDGIVVGCSCLSAVADTAFVSTILLLLVTGDGGGVMCQSRGSWLATNTSYHSLKRLEA